MLIMNKSVKSLTSAAAKSQTANLLSTCTAVINLNQQLRFKSSSGGGGNKDGSFGEGNGSGGRGRKKRKDYSLYSNNNNGGKYNYEKYNYFEPAPSGNYRSSWPNSPESSFSPFSSLPPLGTEDSSTADSNSTLKSKTGGFFSHFSLSPNGRQDNSEGSKKNSKDNNNNDELLQKLDKHTNKSETGGKKSSGQKNPALDFDTGINLKTLDVFQKIIQANSGRQQANRKTAPNRFSPLSLKDAVTLSEYTDILEGMLSKSSPRSLKSHLDEYIIGQDSAKQALSCAVYNHYTRVLQSFRNRKDSMNEFPSKPAKNALDKSNILILGPSGSGKTLMARRIAEILEVPFCMNDATSFTQAGYVGDDVEQCVARLLQSADHDVRKAEIGIVFIDEIDKISKRDSASTSSGRDVAGEGVQQALLKMLEGTTLHVQEKGRKKSDETISIDTTNILFILSGAFVGIDKLVQQRNIGQRMIGFSHKSQGEVAQEKLISSPGVTEVDLINFGLIPEFVGRIPICVTVNRLTEDELVRILSEPKNSLVEQYKQLFQNWNIHLDFTQEALHSIAKKVMHRQTGARGLKFVMEEILKQPMYFCPESEIKRIKIDQQLNCIYETDSSTFTILEDPMGKGVSQRIEVPANAESFDFTLAPTPPAPMSTTPSTTTQPFMSKR